MNPDNCLVNGERANLVSVADRGLTYGDGLFETIAVRGGKARFPDYHLERLLDGCRRLGIGSVSGRVVLDEVSALAADCEYGTAKIIITRGTGKRGYAPPGKSRPTRIVQVGVENPPTAARAPIEARFCQTTISVNARLAGMKTLGRLEHVLARAEWDDSKIGEGLMRTDDGMVICGTMSNIFFVTDQGLFTPDLSRCGVLGVMRRLVMEQAERLGMACQVTNVTADDLLAASEIFVTNSLIGIRSVVRLQDQSLQTGPVTSRLLTSMAANGIVECAA